jgi:hypothetical protein
MDTLSFSEFINDPFVQQFLSKVIDDPDFQRFFKQLSRIETILDYGLLRSEDSFFSGAMLDSIANVYLSIDGSNLAAIQKNFLFSMADKVSKHVEEFFV